MAIPTKLETLKLKADELSIEYDDLATEAELKEKIARISKHIIEPDTPVPNEPKIPTTDSQKILNKKLVEKRRLRRVKITTLDPSKNGIPFEFFSVGNAVVPTQSVAVHFNIETHVPQMILDVIEKKKFIKFVSNPREKEHNQMSKTPLETAAYNIEYLKDLTTTELRTLQEVQNRAKISNGAS